MGLLAGGSISRKFQMSTTHASKSPGKSYCLYKFGHTTSSILSLYASSTVSYELLRCHAAGNIQVWFACVVLISSDSLVSSSAMLVFHPLTSAFHSLGLELKHFSLPQLNFS